MSTEITNDQIWAELVAQRGMLTRLLDFERRMTEIETIVQGNARINLKGLNEQLRELREDLKPVIKGWSEQHELIEKEVKPLVEQWRELRAVSKWAKWVVPLLGGSTLLTLATQLIELLTKAHP